MYETVGHVTFLPDALLLFEISRIDDLTGAFEDTFDTLRLYDNCVT